MNIGVLFKAIVNVSVKPYTRRGRAVAGYSTSRNTRFTAKVKNLYIQHHKNIEKWAALSVGHQKGKGVHFQSFDDATAAGIEEGLYALKRYKPSMGPIENFLRPSIKFGIMKWLVWERSKGMTGTRTLYDLIHRATTDEQREKIIERFPEITEVPETLPSGDIEDQLEAAAALLNRDHLLDVIEKEFNINLKQARAKLEKKEKSRPTWKNTSLAKRKLDIYRMKTFDNMSFREVAEKLGIGVARVYEDFEEAGKVVRKIHAAMQAARPAQDTKKALSGGRSNEERFLQNLARLERAIKNEYPTDYIDFILDRLATLYVQLSDASDSSTSDHQSPNDGD